jgi:uncharacterized protein
LTTFGMYYKMKSSINALAVEHKQPKEICRQRYKDTGNREKEMNDNDRHMVEELKVRISSDARPHLKKLMVFGSRATNRASEDSDLDIIALVDVKTLEIERVLDDAAYQVMWDHDFKPIISLKVFDESRYNDALKKGYSFYKNVEKEGVAV